MILEMLVEMLRLHDSSAVQATLLKSGRVFVEHFVKHVMPFLSKVRHFFFSEFSCV